MLTARLKRLGLKDGDRVLDLGCGEGRHVHGLYLMGNLKIHGVDLDEAPLQKAEEGLATLPKPENDRTGEVVFETGDATALRFDDNTFDAARATWRSLEGKEPLERAFFRQDGGKWVKVA